MKVEKEKGVPWLPTRRLKRARVARESCDPKFTFVCDRGAPISI